MPKVNEGHVYDGLLRYSGEDRVRIGDAEIRLRLRPDDIHATDSPDCLLWIELSFRLFGQQVQLKVPIPVEAEKGGTPGALEDLQKFVERGHYPIQMPMLVVAETGYETRRQKEKFPVEFTITQVPVRVLGHK